MNRIEENWLMAQAEDAAALRRDAHLFELAPAPSPAGRPPRQYLLGFKCRSVARQPSDGQIVERERWAIMIQFHVDYLRSTDSARALVWIQGALWHPNAAPELGLFCVGHLAPGTPLRDLVFRVHEILVYANYATHSALNPAAAAWARNNQHRFPIDPRPLLWRPPVSVAFDAPSQT